MVACVTTGPVQASSMITPMAWERNRSTWQGRDCASIDGANELSMVSLVLIRVSVCELTNGCGEFGPLSDVAIDRHRVTGSSVGPCQCLAARGREVDEPRRDQLGGRNDLHVAELPHVVVPAVQRAPSDEDVRGALGQPLTGDHPRPVVLVHARVAVCCIDRWTSLLDLQEQGVGPGTTLEEHQVDHHSDAADPHDLANDVDRCESIEQAPSVFLQCQSVLGKELVDEIVLLIVADGDADRRILGNTWTPVSHRRELFERSTARAAAALLVDVDRHPSTICRLEVADPAVEVHTVVPDVQLGHRRVATHTLVIGLDASGDCRIGSAWLDPVLPCGDGDAGGAALDVPLERTGPGLVAVTQVG